MSKTEVLDTLVDAIKNQEVKAGVVSDLEWEDSGDHAGQVRYLQVPIKGQPGKFYPYIIQSVHYEDATIIQITCLTDIDNSIIVRVGQGWSVSDNSFENPPQILEKVRSVMSSYCGFNWKK